MNLRINGTEKEIDGGPGALLVYVLRDELGMTGTKIGCAAGICGSCTVLVDGVATRSCITPLTLVEGKEITTIEGLARDGALDPVQQAFIEEQGFQCAFCTPGFILTAKAFLRENPDPTAEEAAVAMSGSICRCGAYPYIVRAVLNAAAKLRGESVPA